MGAAAAAAVSRAKTAEVHGAPREAGKSTDCPARVFISPKENFERARECAETVFSAFHRGNKDPLDASLVRIFLSRFETFRTDFPKYASELFEHLCGVDRDTPCGLAARLAVNAPRWEEWLRSGPEWDARLERWHCSKIGEVATEIQSFFAGRVDRVVWSSPKAKTALSEALMYAIHSASARFNAGENIEPVRDGSKAPSYERINPDSENASLHLGPAQEALNALALVHPRGADYIHKLLQKTYGTAHPLTKFAAELLQKDSTEA
jgi:hypothetical protein